MKFSCLLWSVAMLVGTSAQGKDLKFSYDCKVYSYIGTAENEQERTLKNPKVKKYVLVKTAYKEKGEWTYRFSLELTLKTGEVVENTLVHSGSGDEGYEEYHIPRSERIGDYWISAGSIFNDGSGGRFEGDDGKGKTIFFDCKN